MHDDKTPLLKGCDLWARTSAKGTTYLAGRMGGLRVLIFENTDSSGPSHTLMVGQAAPRRDGPASEAE